MIQPQNYSNILSQEVRASMNEAAEKGPEKSYLTRMKQNYQNNKAKVNQKLIETGLGVGLLAILYCVGVEILKQS